jgi:hypothetical protein
MLAGVVERPIVLAYFADNGAPLERTADRVGIHQ